MFALDQILNATEFVRNFPRIVRHLSKEPQPLLVTHNSRERFVFVNARIYEDLLQYRLSQSGTRHIPVGPGADIHRE